MKKNNLLTILFVCIAILYSCSDIQEEPTLEVEETVSSDIDQNEKVKKIEPGMRILSESFDWETATSVPLGPNENALMPWTGSYQMPEPLLTDYSKFDGWELVYNTFSGEEFYDQTFFALYNKFRGTLRIYYYLWSQELVPSSNMHHSLTVNPGAVPLTHILNFSGKNIIDIDATPLREILTIEPYLAAPRTWYMLEYDLAYDKDINLFGYNSARLGFNSGFSKITQGTANGQAVGGGGISNNLRLSFGDLDLSESSTTNTIVGDGVINMISKSENPGFLQRFGNAFSEGVAGGIENGISGIVSGFISGLFNSGNDATNMKFDMNLDLQLEEFMLWNNVPLPIPGSTITSTTIPVEFDYPLGLFYLENKPTVIQTEYLSSDGMTAPTSTFSYNVEIGSVNIDWSPFLDGPMAEASVQNLKTDIIVSDNNSGMISGQSELFGDLEVRTGSAIQTGSIPGNVLGVRISFTVVPNNGSAPVTVAKAFAVNIIENTVIMPPGEDPV